MTKHKIIARLFRENPLTPFRLVLPPNTAPVSQPRILLENTLENSGEELIPISLESLPSQQNQQEIEKQFLLQNQYILMFRKLKPSYTTTLPHFLKKYSKI